MLSFYKTAGNTIEPIQVLETGCWINLVDPSEEEMNFLIENIHVDVGFLRAALDEEETSRVEIEDEQTLLIVDVPSTERSDGSVIFSTLPMGIIVMQEYIITVCLKETSVLRNFCEGTVKNVQTSLKTRFILFILLRIANRYLHYLRQIE